jgi:hypothetical protein
LVKVTTVELQLAQANTLVAAVAELAERVVLVAVLAGSVEQEHLVL